MSLLGRQSSQSPLLTRQRRARPATTRTQYWQRMSVLAQASIRRVRSAAHPCPSRRPSGGRAGVSAPDTRGWAAVAAGMPAAAPGRRAEGRRVRTRRRRPDARLERATAAGAVGRSASPAAAAHPAAETTRTAPARAPAGPSGQRARPARRPARNLSLACHRRPSTAPTKGDGSFVLLRRPSSGSPGRAGCGRRRLSTVAARSVTDARPPPTVNRTRRQALHRDRRPLP